MELVEMISTGVLKFHVVKTRKQDIEDALVEYGYLSEDDVKLPRYQLLIETWAKYVLEPKEDFKKYSYIKFRLIEEFGSSYFYWLLDNTYLLHQVSYLERKGLPTRGIEQRVDY